VRKLRGTCRTIYFRDFKKTTTHLRTSDHKAHIPISSLMNKTLEAYSYTKLCGHSLLRKRTQKDMAVITACSNLYPTGVAI
jgi:hypothetical protein